MILNIIPWIVFGDVGQDTFQVRYKYTYEPNSLSLSYLSRPSDRSILSLSLSLSHIQTVKPAGRKASHPGTVLLPYHRRFICHLSKHNAVGNFCSLMSKPPTVVTKPATTGWKCSLIYVANISIPVCAPPCHVHSFASSSITHRSSTDHSTSTLGSAARESR